MLFLIVGKTKDGQGSPKDVVTLKKNASIELFQFFCHINGEFNVSAFFTVLVFIQVNYIQGFKLPLEFRTKDKQMPV